MTLKFCNLLLLFSLLSLALRSYDRDICSLDSIFGALSFVGVILVAQPKWLFPGITQRTSADFPTSSTVIPPTIISPYFDSCKYLKGVLLSLVAAISLSLYFVMNTYIGKSLTTILNVFYPSVSGTLIPPFVMLAMGDKFLFTELDAVGWTLILIGVMYFLAMMLEAESFQMENLGPAMLSRGLDIIYALIIQVVLIGVGMSIILITTSLLILNRWLDIYS